MTLLTVAFVIILWFPIVVVFLHNLWWDLRLWQSNDYRPGRLIHHLVWDSELTHRKAYRTVLKAFLAIFSLVFLVEPMGIIPLGAILLSYVLWVNDCFDISEKAASFRRGLRFDLRTLAVFTIGLVTLLFLITSISATLFADNIGGVWQLNFLSNATLQNSSWDNIIPSAIFFVFISSLAGHILDLGSPIVTSLLVLVTSPLAALHSYLIINKAREQVNSLPDLKVIAITGSSSKTTIKNMLSSLLSKDYKVAKTSASENSIVDLAETILREVQPTTQVLIADLNGYSQEELAKMSWLLTPEYIVFTGNSSEHAALFGSQEKALEANWGVVKYADSNCTLIINGDDEELIGLLKGEEAKKIIYKTRKETSWREEDITSLIEVATLEDVTSNESKTLSELHFSSKYSPLIVTLPYAYRKFTHSALASVCLGIELGLELDEINTSMSRLSESPTHLEVISGDWESTLLYNPARTTKRTLLQDIEELTEHSRFSRPHMLVLPGIRRLGKSKINTYKEIITTITDKIDFVFTYDRQLAALLASEHSQAQVVLVHNYNELLYAIRKRIEPGTTILIASEVDINIINSLRSG